MCELLGRTMLALALVTAATVAAADTDADLRDPLRPPDWGESDAGDGFDAGAWRLASTLIAEGRRVAIVNGRIVRAGEVVGGARVLAIAPGRVELDYRGRRFTVRRETPRVRQHDHGGAD